MALNFLEEAARFFSGELPTLNFTEGGVPTTEELQLGCAIILVEFARGDGALVVEEAESVVERMKRNFGLSDSEAVQYLQLAQSAGQKSGKVDQVISQLKSGFSVEQRVRVLAMVWEVIGADGLVDEFERRYAAIVREKLGLSMEQALQARKLAEGGNV